MTALDQLVKLHKWTVQEKQKTLAELERLLARLRRELELLNEELERERSVAAEAVEVSVTFIAYLDSIVRRRTKLQASISELEISADRVRDELGGAFQEMKRVEIVQRNQTEQARQRNERRGQRKADEQAMQNMRRRSTAS